ncbi:MAG: hypothetical protein Q8K78_13535 [Planctomycetaceae bacterium]|nr:hypothetical protein [Planctomycetaceae bacterium]
MLAALVEFLKPPPLYRLPWDNDRAADVDRAVESIRSVETETDRQQHRLHDLERQVERLNLVVIALCELITKSGTFSRETLQATIDEIDLRDGTKDGRIRVAPSTCPQCDRPNHRLRTHCLYCGAALEADSIA